MDAGLLRSLREINDEERRVLEDGGVNMGLYIEGEGSVINYRKLLAANKLIDIRKHTRFVGFPEHSHDYVEMVYMCAGQTTHIVNGAQITLKQGEILLLNQYAKQEILPAGSGDIAVNFIILPEFFDSAVAMMGAEENVLRRFLVAHLRTKESAGRFLHFRVAEELPVQNLMENLTWTLYNDIPNKRGIHQLTMGLLFLLLLNYSDKIDAGRGADDLELRIMRYIEEHYVRGSLTQLAESLHHDVFWLSREIKKRVGKTYKELIQEKRVRQAKLLLDASDMGVAEIAERVGYSNLSYFHRLFREATGASPAAYRRSGK